MNLAAFQLLDLTSVCSKCYGNYAQSNASGKRRQCVFLSRSVKGGLYELEHHITLSTEFRVAGPLLENVKTFSYLGQIVSATAENWFCVSRNLCNPRKTAFL